MSNLNSSIMRYIPAKKRPAIRECYYDDDGYWITLQPGWHVEDYYAERTIHEDTINELRKVIPHIQLDE